MDRVVVPQQRNHSLELVQLCANGVHQNQGRASACGVVALREPSGRVKNRTSPRPMLHVVV